MKSFEELEYLYNHWHEEYLFYKSESITSIMLIIISYFASLFSLISNKNIEIGYFMYALCIYCVLWTIHDIFKLRKAIKEKNIAEEELLVYFYKK